MQSYCRWLLRFRPYSQPAALHWPHGFSFCVPVLKQAEQGSQSALLVAPPITPVQRFPAVICEHWPLIISGEYETAPQRVHTATGCVFCSGMVRTTSSKGHDISCPCKFARREW